MKNLSELVFEFLLILKKKKLIKEIIFNFLSWLIEKLIGKFPPFCRSYIPLIDMMFLCKNDLPPCHDSQCVVTGAKWFIQNNSQLKIAVISFHSVPLFHLCHSTKRHVHYYIICTFRFVFVCFKSSAHFLLHPEQMWHCHSP